QFPVDSIPLATWNATVNNWDATGTDVRSNFSSGRSFVAGSNVSLAQVGNQVTISALTGLVPTDMTAFDRSYVFGESGASGSASWSSLMSCAGGAGTAGTAGEPAGVGWSSMAAPCFVYYPGGDGASFPISDFISGSSPKNYMLIGRYGRGSPSGL